MRQASAGIVKFTTAPFFFYLECFELLYCFIGIIVIISSSADGGGGIHFVPITCCSAAVVIASVPAAVFWCLVDLLVV